MFANTLAMFKSVEVRTESDGTVRVLGMKTETFINEVDRLWKTSKITSFIFKNVKSYQLDLLPFFVPDFYYICKRLLGERRTRINRTAVQQIINQLEKNTWIKGTIGDTFVSKLNYGKLDLFNVTPMPHQRDFFRQYDEFTYKWHLNGYVLGASVGSGKALKSDTPVRVPGGWTPIGELKVGNVVADAHGGFTRVIGVYPQGEKQLYKVKFKDGREIECCEEHLWKYTTSTSHPTDKWLVGNTAEMINRLNNGQRLHIPLTEAVDDVEEEHYIDPYAIGVLIGDGCLSNNTVGWDKPESFMVSEMRRLLPKELEISERSDGKYKGIVIKEQLRNTGYKHPWKIELKRLGLMGKRSWEKVIPEQYMGGSLRQRLAIVQGLLDTDGYIDNQSTVSYTTTSETLAKQFQQLIWSLGGIASISNKRKYFTYKGERKLGRPAYQVNVRFRKPSWLFRLPRKACRANDDNQYSNTLRLQITSIEKTITAPAVCISVAHNEKLFVTKDYIVTHNTLMALFLSECLETDITICIVPKSTVEKVWKDTLETRFKKTPEFWYSTSGEEPTVGKRYYVGHYEQLPRLVEFFKRKEFANKRINIVLDESHNLNEIKSARTETLIELAKVVGNFSIIWTSGTPLKAMGSEVIPLFRTIDPYFTPKAEEAFKKVYGLSSARGLDILAHRLGYSTFKVDKAQVHDGKVEHYRVDVTIPNGSDYTLEAIGKDMSKFILERQDYYAMNKDKFIEQYFSALKIYERLLKTPAEFKAYEEYTAKAKVLHLGYDSMIHKEEPIFCNQYEKKLIIPNLPKELRETFKNVRSVYKYVSMKIQGEALGRILGKKREQCNVDMLQAINSYKVTNVDTGEQFTTSLSEIVENSVKKTLIFSSYVAVIESLYNSFKVAGAFPLKMTGENGSDLPQIVTQFERDSRSNPLVASLQMLSTGVPLIMASSVVFLNAPFRDYLYTQAVARLDRLGQTETVQVYDVFLDTGLDPNISTRSQDLMLWSRDQVALMTGVKVMDVALESYEDVYDSVLADLPTAGVKESSQIESLNSSKNGSSYAW